MTCADQSSRVGDRPSCGTGPDILVDGDVTSRTSVTARADQFMNGDTVAATDMRPAGGSPAGQHQVAVRSSAKFSPVIPRSPMSVRSVPLSVRQSPDIEQWGATTALVAVAEQAQQQVLEIAENFNPGGGRIWRSGFAVRARRRLEAGLCPPGGPAARFPWTTPRTPRIDGAWRSGCWQPWPSCILAVRPRRCGCDRRWPPRPLRHVTAAIVGMGVLLSMGPWGCWRSGRPGPGPSIAAARSGLHLGDSGYGSGRRRRDQAGVCCGGPGPCAGAGVGGGAVGRAARS